MYKKDLNCATCSCGATCPNKVLFNMKEYIGHSKVSNPIVINAYQPDDNYIDLDVKLFGIGITSAKTMETILTEGIYLGKNRERFRADRINYIDSHNKHYDQMILAETKDEVEDINKITVDFISPTHIQKDCMDLVFQDFLRCCMYRYMALNELTHSEPEIDFNNLVESAREVRTIEKIIKTENLGRFSGRTQTKNNVPCIKGRVVYEGNLSQYMSILRLAELFNIGKWCSMGLGHIRIKAERI